MFSPGQKIECVDSRLEANPNHRRTPLIKGAVYAVREVGGRTEAFVRVDGLGGLWWPARRFRPLVERKTDISIFTAMLKPQKVTA